MKNLKFLSSFCILLSFVSVCNMSLIYLDSLLLILKHGALKKIKCFSIFCSNSNDID